MLTKHAVLPTLCLFTVMPVLAAGHTRVRGSVPPASFLNYHVATVHELSQEVTLDPAVRARLANHFHVTEAQITQYVRQNLVLTHLQKAGNYRIACVGSDGREYWISSRLPVGTAVFAARATGRPILKLACGNPMVSYLPPGLQTAENNGHSGAPSFAFLPPPALTDTLPMPGLLPGDLTPSDALVALADVPPAVVLVSPSVETLITSTTAPGVSRSFNIVPALLGGLAVAVASTGHHGSTTNVTPPPVPEASTFVSFSMMILLGGGALFAIKRKRALEKAA